MARMSNKRRLEWSFFLNDRSRITYNELCRKCQHECKQSFRAVVVDCPKYLSKRSKKKDKTAGNGKNPLGTKGRTSIHSLKTMYRASCGAYLCR